MSDFTYLGKPLSWYINKVKKTQCGFSPGFRRAWNKYILLKHIEKTKKNANYREKKQINSIDCINCRNMSYVSVSMAQKGVYFSQLYCNKLGININEENTCKYAKKR
jgi:hypothetical protein